MFSECILRLMSIKHLPLNLSLIHIYISLSELVDPELVGDMTFELIITAFLIRRYGCGVLNAERSKRC